MKMDIASFTVPLEDTAAMVTTTFTTAKTVDYVAIKVLHVIKK